MIRTSVKQILNLPLSLLKTNFSKNPKTKKIIISFPLPFHCFPSSQIDTLLNRNIERDQIPYFSIPLIFFSSSFSSPPLLLPIRFCSPKNYPNERPKWVLSQFELISFYLYFGPPSSFYLLIKLCIFHFNL